MTDIHTPEKCFENLPLACALLFNHYQIKYLNRHMVNFLNISKNTGYIEKSFLELISKPDQAKFIHMIKNSGHPSDVPEWKIYRVLDGDLVEKQFLMSAQKQNSDPELDCSYLVMGVPVNHGIFAGDLQVQLETQNPLQTTDNRYEHLFNRAKIGIAVLNDSGRIEEMNIAFADHIGAKNADIANQDCKNLLSGNNYEKLYDLITILKKSKQSFVKDVIYVDNADCDQRILEISLSELFNEHENSTKLMLFTEDITHQQDTHAVMLQSEKLTLTGRLAASLAHEINNPLQTSLGCLGLVEEMLDDRDDRDLAIYIKMAIEELQRSARIVKKLRDLNRTTDSSERSPVDIREIIEGVLILTKNHLYDKQIVPVFPYQGPSATALASKDQIQQVILNLVMNAIDAMPNGGNIYLDIIFPNKSKGISIKIRDTGNGIDPEIKANLFDPFITTKEDGLGLGLYICKQIIDSHSGSLDFESELGQGTEFTIWLPDADHPRDKD
jgi:PAS domain S-box-containing protein